MRENEKKREGERERVRNTGPFYGLSQAVRTELSPIGELAE